MNCLKQLQRFLAGFVVLTFFVTNTLTPAPIAYAANVESAAFFSGFKIPTEFGKITNVTRSPLPESHLLIHIQEAHANYDAQKNIKNILEHLAKDYGIKLILVEGAGGKLRPELLKFFPGNAGLQEAVNKKLMQAGELTGAEAMLIDSGDKKTEGWGIENAGAYAENREAYRKVYQGRKLAESFLDAFYRQWQKSADQALNKPLREFLGREFAFEEERLPLQEWMAFLKAEAMRDLELDLDDVREQREWPVLVRYFRLKKIDSRSDPARIQTEQKTFLEDLRTRKIPAPLLQEITELLNQKNAGGLPFRKPRFVFERLMDFLPKNYSFEAYPVFRLRLQQLILLSELQSESLQEEIRALTRKMTAGFIKTEQEQKLADVLHRYRLLKKLFSLELGRKDFLELQSQKITPEKITDALALSPSKLSPITSLFENAIHFYEGAITREDHMMQRAREIMKERKETKAVMITGGFHTDGLKQKITSSGSSYIGISPAIGAIAPDFEKNYLTALLGSSAISRSHIAQIPLSTGRAFLQNVSPRFWRREFSERLARIRDIIRQTVASFRDSVEENNAEFDAGFQKLIASVVGTSMQFQPAPVLARSETRDVSIMDVLLVNLVSPKFKGIQAAAAINSLAAYVRKKEPGIKILNIDMYGQMREREKASGQEFAWKLLCDEVVAKIQEAKPRIVGLSAKWGALDVIDRILDGLEAMGEERPLIVLGNTLATFAYKEMFERYQNYGPILLTVGEGEEALTQIAKIALSHENYRDVRLYKGITNVGISPYDEPVRTALALNGYPVADETNGWEQFKAHDWALGIETSRGCPWGHCTFCSIAALYGKGQRQWRPFPLEVVLKQIEQFVAKGIRFFSINDSEFIGPIRTDEEFKSSMKRAEDFARGVLRINKKYKVGGHIQFSNVSVRADNLIPTLKETEEWRQVRQKRIDEVFRLLKEAGIEKLYLGIESGDEEQLRQYSKGATVELNKQAVAKVRELGFILEVGFIFIDPVATIRTLKNNIKFIEETRLYETDSRLFGKLRIQEGSRYEQIARNKDLIAGDLDLDNLSYAWKYEDSKAGEIANLFEHWEEATNGLVKYLRAVKTALKGKSSKQTKFLQKLCTRIRETDFRFMKEVVNLYPEEKEAPGIAADAQLAALVGATIKRFKEVRKIIFDDIEKSLKEGVFFDTENRLRTSELPLARKTNDAFKARSEMRQKGIPLHRPFGKTGLELFTFGLGTIWFGRRWPKDNKAYVSPSDEELVAVMGSAFENLGNREGSVMIDTAAAYGLTEKRLGKILKEHPEWLEKAFIATKWGENFSVENETSVLDHSPKNLVDSVQNSMQLLPKIDLLYIHGTTVAVLKNSVVKILSQRIKKEHWGGIRFLGASISDEKVLETALAEDLLEGFDVIQLPARIFRTRKDLTEKISEKGLAIVLNTPMRQSQHKDLSAYEELLADPRISMVLLGTRGHWNETIQHIRQLSAEQSLAYRQAGGEIARAETRVAWDALDDWDEGNSNWEDPLLRIQRPYGRSELRQDIGLLMEERIKSLEGTYPKIMKVWKILWEASSLKNSFEKINKTADAESLVAAFKEAEEVLKSTLQERRPSILLSVFDFTKSELWVYPALTAFVAAFFMFPTREVKWITGLVFIGAVLWGVVPPFRRWFFGSKKSAEVYGKRTPLGKELELHEKLLRDAFDSIMVQTVIREENAAAKQMNIILRTPRSETRKTQLEELLNRAEMRDKALWVLTKDIERAETSHFGENRLIELKRALGSRNFKEAVEIARGMEHLKDPRDALFNSVIDRARNFRSDLSSKVEQFKQKIQKSFVAFGMFKPDATVRNPKKQRKISHWRPISFLLAGIIMFFVWAKEAYSGGFGVPDQPSIVSTQAGERRIFVREPQQDGTLGLSYATVMKGVNWSPASTNSNPAGNPAAFRQEFFKWYAKDIPIMSQMGVNTVRLYYDMGTNAQAKAVLDMFYQYGIKVIMPVTAPYYNDAANSNNIPVVVNAWKNHPAIFGWGIGNEWDINYYYDKFTTLRDAAQFTEQCAQIVAGLDTNHPTITFYSDPHIAMGDYYRYHYLNPDIAPWQDTNRINFTSIAINDWVPSVKVWGLQIYRGASFTDAISQWSLITTKPFFLSEYGADSYDHRVAAENPTMQREFNVGLWDEILFHLAAERSSGVVSGALSFEWNDEWYKGGTPGVHTVSSSVNGGQPDGYNDEEWFGILDINRNPKSAYYGIQGRFTLDGQNGIPLVTNPVLTATSGNPAVFTLDGKTVFSRSGADGKGARGLNIAILDEKTGTRIKEYRHFDTWFYSGQVAPMQSIADYLNAIPTGSIVMIAVADSSGLNKYYASDWPVFNALESLGSTEIRTAPLTSWAMITKKGTGKYAETSTTSPITTTPTIVPIRDADRRQALNPVESPVIEGLKLTNGNFQVAFQSQDAFVYQIEYSDDLTTGDWKLAFRGLVADGTSTTWTDDGSFTGGTLPQKRFYRIVVIDRVNRSEMRESVGKQNVPLTPGSLSPAFISGDDLVRHLLLDRKASGDSSGFKIAFINNGKTSYAEQRRSEVRQKEEALNKRTGEEKSAMAKMDRETLVRRINNYKVQVSYLHSAQEGTPEGVHVTDAYEEEQYAKGRPHLLSEVNRHLSRSEVRRTELPPSRSEVREAKGQLLEGVGEMTPDWQRRNSMMSVLLEGVSENGTGVLPEVFSEVSAKLQNLGIGVASEQLEGLLSSLEKIGLIKRAEGSYELSQLPRFIAVKTDDPFYIKKDIERALEAGEETLGRVIFKYSEMENNWPLYPVEWQWPVLRAVALLDKDKQEKLADFLKEHEKFMKYPVLVDSILLMLGARSEKKMEGWLKQYAPQLEGRDIYYISPETVLLAGGLGRVGQFHTKAGQKLAGKSAKVILIEARYRYKLLPSGEQIPLDYGELLQDLHEADSFQVAVRGKAVQAKVFRGTNEEGQEVYLIDGGDYYTRLLYRYGAKYQSGEWGEFSEFLSRASLELIRKLESENKKEKKGDYKAPVLWVNDGQLGPLPVFKRMLDEASDVLKRALVWMVTHTYRNRGTFEGESGFVTGMDLEGKWKNLFKRGYQWDATSGGIRAADGANAVAAIHRDEKAKTDRQVVLHAVTNGDDLDNSASVFDELLEALFPDAYAKQPTSEQIIAVKKAAKNRLNEKYGYGVNPEEPVISYSGRFVDEKAGLKRAFTHGNLRRLVSEGAQILYFANVQELPDRNFGRLQELAQEINETGPGKLVVVTGWGLEEQREVLAATDLQVQDSDRETGAAEFTEADISRNGGLQMGPPWIEGIIQRQGVVLDRKIPGSGNTLIPKSENPDDYYEVFKWVLGTFRENRTHLASYQAASVRLSAVLNAELTSAAYFRLFSKTVYKKDKLADLVGNVKTAFAMDTPKAFDLLKGSLEAISEFDLQTVQKTYGEAKVPAVMRLIAALAPHCLERIRNWDEETFEILEAVVHGDETAQLFRTGDIMLHQSSNKDALVISRSDGNSNLVFASHFGLVPYDQIDGKVWLSVYDIGRILGSPDPLKYQAWDYSLVPGEAKAYPALRKKTDLIKEWKIGITVQKGARDETGYIQHGRHGQILQLRPVERSEVRNLVKVFFVAGVAGSIANQFKQSPEDISGALREPGVLRSEVRQKEEALNKRTGEEKSAMAKMDRETLVRRINNYKVQASYLHSAQEGTPEGEQRKFVFDVIVFGEILLKNFNPLKVGVWRRFEKKTQDFKKEFEAAFERDVWRKRFFEETQKWKQSKKDTILHEVGEDLSWVLGHEERTAWILYILGKELVRTGRITEGELWDWVLAGYVHDIGKFNLDPKIINKTGHLTDDEFAVIRQHVEETGKVILEIFDSVGMAPDLHRERVRKFAAEHHEAFNGSGYADALARRMPFTSAETILRGSVLHHEDYAPDKAGYPLNLSGEGIILGARYARIADAFEAIVGLGRPYPSFLFEGAIKAAAGEDRELTEADLSSVILEDFRKEKGRLYDPEATDLFLELVGDIFQTGPPVQGKAQGRSEMRDKAEVKPSAGRVASSKGAMKELERLHSASIITQKGSTAYEVEGKKFLFPWGAQEVKGRRGFGEEHKAEILVALKDLVEGAQAHASQISYEVLFPSYIAAREPSYGYNSKKPWTKTLSYAQAQKRRYLENPEIDALVWGELLGVWKIVHGEPFVEQVNYETLGIEAPVRSEARSEKHESSKAERALWRLTKKMLKRLRLGYGWVSWADATDFHGELSRMHGKLPQLLHFVTARQGRYWPALLSQFFTVLGTHLQTAYDLSMYGRDPRGIPVFLNGIYRDLNRFLFTAAWRERDSESNLWKVVEMKEDLSQILIMAGLPALGSARQIVDFEPILTEKVAPQLVSGSLAESVLSEAPSPAFPVMPSEIMVWRVNAKKIGIILNGKNLFAEDADELVTKFNEIGVKAQRLDKKMVVVGDQTLRWNDTATLEESLRTLLAAPGQAVRSEARILPHAAEFEPKDLFDGTLALSSAAEFFAYNKKAGGGFEQGVRVVTEKITDGIIPLLAHSLNAAEAVISLLPASLAQKTAETLMQARFAAARKMLGVKTVQAGDVFILGREFALGQGFLEAARDIFGDVPVAVVARDGDDVAFLERFNVELSESQQVLITSDSAADIAATKAKLLGRVKTGSFNLQVLLYGAETLKSAIPDNMIQRITQRMFQNFLKVAGESVSARVNRMAEEFRAITRSA